jgi:hypothetical protein
MYLSCLGSDTEFSSKRIFCQHCRPEASNAVAKEVLAGRAEIGAAGIYTTPTRVTTLTMASPHTQDCVTFMTLTSTALPR